MLTTVHIIEDDDSVAWSVSALLLAAGFSPRRFGSADEFLEAAPDAEPGVILMDISLPGMCGISALEALRAQGVSWPVLIMTGWLAADWREPALASGATAFFEKPFESKTLIKAVSRALMSLTPTPGSETEACDARR